MYFLETRGVCARRDTYDEEQKVIATTNLKRMVSFTMVHVNSLDLKL